MAIDDDEARRTAEAMVAAIGSGDDAAVADLESRYPDPRDAIDVRLYLWPMLTDAVRRVARGDDTPATARLAAYAWDRNDERVARDAEAAAAKSQRIAERQETTLRSVGPVPYLVHRMTGVGPRGIPLPDDVTPDPDDDDFVLTRVADPQALMAFYIAHMRAKGWTLDLDDSRPIADAPQCYFARPDFAGRCVHILTGRTDDDDDGPTRLLISEVDDD